MAEGRFISYLRVSTKRQGSSGLGLEAQRETVRGFLNGGSWTLLEQVVEVESGKDTERQHLRRALSLCRLHGATLVVAKLDRLARNAAFLLSLRDAGVNFVVAGMPGANRLTVGVLAVVAQDELQQTSERTKEALQAAKARGVKLGRPENLSAEARRKGTVQAAARRREVAQARAADLLPVIEALRQAGAHSLHAIARGLNAEGISAPRGGTWSAAQVARVLRS